ncbi:Uncharacterised protein [Mycobacteroides abscessus subsp. abscessus]|nr:Uncharacterised protein [Mycobacteroides abscessus subsp. abscessus]
MRASGSNSSTAAFIASTRSPSNVVSYAGSSCTHSRSTSGPMISSTSRSKASNRPGNTRQSMTASAVAGMTLALYPALSMVGLAVSRSVAPTILPIEPSLATVPSKSGESGSKS